MAAKGASEERAGVALSSLDSPVTDGPETKRDLVDYLDAVADRIVPVLAERPLSVIRVRPGQEPFMQKNVPRYAPEWLRTTTIRSQTGRDVHYALVDDRRSLLWFANQRAVEYHPGLFTVGASEPAHLVLDLDPPEGAGFDAVVAVATLVRQALAVAGLEGAVKTSGAKGVHILVPLRDTAFDDAAAATRALAARTERLDPSIATTAFVREDREGKVFVDSTRAGGATIVAAYSPRIRPGLPVSYPVAWDELGSVTPGDFTIATVPGLIGAGDPWRDAQPAPQTLPADLVAEGHEIPIARVQAMHEGKRRKRARERGET
ncbi:ATP-dependent DNA ligase [Pseudonocardia ailaonensis]|uniref:ATP-dependent DNA ligase n=1 Tax=Pseudonocardia ailaonensis TaxID=367279 RepID=A0ABN2MQF9_9PSEU